MNATTPLNIKDDLFWGSPINNTIELTNKAIAKAKQTPDLAEKRTHYDEAFAVFRKTAQGDGTLPPELEVPFFTFLEAYAKETCYAQQGKTPEEGFEKSARLMELSLLLQLKSLNMIDFSFNWAKCDNLEALINEAGDDLLETVRQLQISSDVLLPRAQNKGMRESLAATLKRMTFSHQNIPSLNKDNLPFHKRYNDLTEKLFEKPIDLAEYRYNRCAFLINLGPETDKYDKKIQAYDSVLEMFRTECASGDADLKRILQGKMSQINNMKGILNKDRPEAEGYFREAFAMRQALLEDATDTANDEFLLSNIRTGLIHCLCQKPLQLDRLNEAKGHAQALFAYVQKNQSNHNVHAYVESYKTAMLKTNAAFMQFISEQKKVDTNV